MFTRSQFKKKKKITEAPKTLQWCKSSRKCNFLGLFILQCPLILTGAGTCWSLPAYIISSQQLWLGEKKQCPIHLDFQKRSFGGSGEKLPFPQVPPPQLCCLLATRGTSGVNARFACFSRLFCLFLTMELKNQTTNNPGAFYASALRTWSSSDCRVLPSAATNNLSHSGQHFHLPTSLQSRRQTRPNYSCWPMLVSVLHPV